jgi:2-polyprenyl-3-methyl-5-hydroxy-6-metoxy-1,4-benzoquinol methylase
MDSPSPNAIDFSQRAELEEQIDGPCSYEELRDCLRDLAAVNRLVLAHRPIFQWLERVAAMHPEVRPLRIVDVGSGYGDMLRRIETWAAKRGIAVELTGVDINAHALRSARESTPPSSRIRWILCDVTTCAELGEVDLITTCGVMHHLTEPHIVDFLRWSEETARIG